jgi:phosphoglycerol transferase MdoB-like AlkP superfamily enzyme
VSKLNTLAYNGGIFYIIIVSNIYSLGQCIIIFILLFKNLKRLELIFILLSSVFIFLLIILFDFIIYNRRLYNKEAITINL